METGRFHGNRLRPSAACHRRPASSSTSGAFQTARLVLAVGHFARHRNSHSKRQFGRCAHLARSSTKEVAACSMHPVLNPVLKVVVRQQTMYDLQAIHMRTIRLRAAVCVALAVLTALPLCAQRVSEYGNDFLSSALNFQTIWAPAATAAFTTVLLPLITSTEN
jgi:hypothetical protein